MSRLVWVSLAVIVILFLAIHVAGVPIRDSAQRILRPLGISLNTLAQAVERQIYLGDNAGGDHTSRTEVNQLRTEVLELDRLREENQQLKEELSFVHGTERETITTEVINYNPDQSRDAVRIHAGSDHGIEPDMPVVAQSALVGRVRHVSAKTAEVVLVTDTTFRVLSRVESGPEGVLRGQIGGGLTLYQLPRDPDIDTGDVVSTSGLDGVYPPGILIGTVRSLARTPGEVLSTAQITPAVKHRDLHVVTVIRTP